MKNCLVIGAGGIGLRHIKILKFLNYKIFLYELNNVISVKLKKVNYIDVILNNLNNINSFNFEFSVICSPSQTHLEYCKILIKHNIPFLCEKPFSNTLVGLDKFNLVLKKSKVKSCVGYPRRSSKGVIRIKDILDSRKFGNLRIIKSNFSQDFRKYRPDYKNTYYSKINSGGGAIFDALTHHIDLLIFFAGKIKSVSSISKNLVFSGVEGEDFSLNHFIFENGVIGDVHCNQFQKPNYDKIEFICSKANISFDRISNVIKIKKDDSGNFEEIQFDDDWDEIFKMQTINFIENNINFQTSVDEAIHNVQVCQAIRESSKLNKSISINEN
tara:strand:+ start:18 stop:1001 length:984 start_codon:yes stop_codon:yes gene_type:complete